MRNKGLTLIDLALPRIESRNLSLAKDVILVLSFSIITAICAKIKIEIGVVPITMQTLAVLLSGALLGSKRGALSQVVYLLMGLAGLPWFSRGGGIVYILSPTFGYIIGFVFAAFFVGWLSERGIDKTVKKAILTMLAGNIVLYIPGLLWLSKFVGFSKVLAVGLYPFLFGDALKLILAGSVLPIGRKTIENIKN